MNLALVSNGEWIYAQSHVLCTKFSHERSQSSVDI